MSRAYYNEFEPKAAAALRALIEDGFIAPGDVDERPIQEVQASDLRGYTQCHFFAGIGLWSVALRAALWPDERPVWTGSCPCQPYSAAGKRQGATDDRDLWPVWFRLIAECRPPVIFGEQVASAIAHGWLDRLANDLENEGYAIGSAVLPACSAGAFHKRERLWFVANAIGGQLPQARARSSERVGQSGNDQGGFVADSNGGRFRPPSLDRQHREKYNAEPCGDVADSAGTGRCASRSTSKTLSEPKEIKRPDGLCGDGAAITLGNPICAGLEGFAGHEQGCGGGADCEQTSYHVKSLWLTPSANEDAAGTVNGKMQKMLTHQAKESSGSTAPTEKPGQLCPEFVFWLMGFPNGYLYSVQRGMQSIRGQRRNSSKQRRSV